jgi:hypothetical protein
VHQLKGTLSLAAFCIQYEIMVQDQPWRLLKITEGFEWATLFPPVTRPL